MKFCDNPKCVYHVEADEHTRLHAEVAHVRHEHCVMKRRGFDYHCVTIAWLCDDCHNAVEFLKAKELEQ